MRAAASTATAATTTTTTTTTTKIQPTATPATVRHITAKIWANTIKPDSSIATKVFHLHNANTQHWIRCNQYLLWRMLEENQFYSVWISIQNGYQSCRIRVSNLSVIDRECNRADMLSFNVQTMSWVLWRMRASKGWEVFHFGFSFVFLVYIIIMFLAIKHALNLEVTTFLLQDNS